MDTHATTVCLTPGQAAGPGKVLIGSIGGVIYLSPGDSAS
jgi:hypothetical protein